MMYFQEEDAFSQFLIFINSRLRPEGEVTVPSETFNKLLSQGFREGWITRYVSGEPFVLFGVTVIEKVES